MYIFQALVNGTQYNITINITDSNGNSAVNFTIITTLNAALKSWTPQGDINLRKRFGTEGLKRIKKFDWDNVISSYTGLYNGKM